jgi:predicted flap endonuclease-1-like 5' DNA nuclease
MGVPLTTLLPVKQFPQALVLCGATAPSADHHTPRSGRQALRAHAEQQPAPDLKRVVGAGDVVEHEAFRDG